MLIFEYIGKRSIGYLKILLLKKGDKVKKCKVIIGLVVIKILLTSCNIAKDDEKINNQVLSGKICGEPFSFVSGVAKSKDDSWEIKLYQEELKTVVHADGSFSYLGSYPLLVFSIPKNSEPQKYNISTYETIGIVLIGILTQNYGATEFLGTSFNTGEIDILSISSSGISGYITAENIEDNSKLNGKFSVLVPQIITYAK